MLSAFFLFTYDAIDCFTTADYFTRLAYQYSYDPVGNRLQQIINGYTTTYQYDAANRLTSVAGVAYTWDNRGNLLSDGVRTLPMSAKPP